MWKIEKNIFKKNEPEKIPNFFFVESSEHPQSIDKIKSRATSEEMMSGKNNVSFYKFPL